MGKRSAGAPVADGRARAGAGRALHPLPFHLCGGDEHPPGDPDAARPDPLRRVEELPGRVAGRERPPGRRQRRGLLGGRRYRGDHFGDRRNSTARSFDGCNAAGVGAGRARRVADRNGASDPDGRPAAPRGRRIDRRSHSSRRGSPSGCRDRAARRLPGRSAGDGIRSLGWPVLAPRRRRAALRPEQLGRHHRRQAERDRR